MRRALVAISLILLVSGSVLVDSSPANACTEQQRRDRDPACASVGGSTTDDAAVLNGSQPGGRGNGNSGGNSAGNGNGNSGGSNTSVPLTCATGLVSPACDRSAFSATTLPVPTLDDIAAFRPTPGVDHMEPNGWFVVGLDANFYATGGASVVPGTLLGYEASVRFTPIRWQWFYGDGSTTTTSTRGGTWKSLGITEFDPTPTSHVYQLAGTYYIDLTIGYRAEYSFNGSTYAPIVGTLWLPANRLVATVGSAKTVLVERDCVVNPTGPGCSN